MSKRLQVILGDEDFEQLRAVARQEGITVSEWVRRSLRQAGRSSAAGDLDTKLAVLRAGMRHAFPTADIEEMLGDIERGYGP